MSDLAPTVLQFNPIFLGELLAKLEGCEDCVYDEAEGLLVNHCDQCCREITARTWELFHKQAQPTD